MPEISLKDFAQVMWHGLPLDFSMSAYVCVVPFLLVTVSVFKNWSVLQKITKIYSIVLFALATLIFSADLDLYAAWGFRIDSSVFMYLKTPKDAVASFDAWLVVRQLCIMTIVFFALYFCYKKLIDKDFCKFSPVKKKYSIAFILLVVALFYPIRGGFSDATMNVGWVYYSKNMFLNHAAVNPTWNLLNSMAHSNIDFTKEYRYFADEELPEAMSAMLPKRDSTFTHVLKTDRPNIILVILESFAANVVAPLGGENGVTPNLNALCDEGILFTDFYGNSYRTDRGVMCVMSGYPVPAKYSIMKNPNKTANIPNIGNELKNVGYDIAFYYGGDENFTNMRSYLVNGGFEKIVSNKDFSLKDAPTSWGAADDVVFKRLLNDLNEEKHEKPFFRTLLTLSSHEPFKVPMETKFVGESRDDKYRNSVYYTDSAIGEFVRSAKKTSWWENTLMIFVSDHSFPYPEGITNYEPNRYRIPCLWIGGALENSCKIEKPASQIDICATLLSQLGICHDDFIFSKNLFDDSQNAFGFYSYYHGFGLKTADSFCAYDLDSEKIIEDNRLPADEQLANRGKAFMQYIFNDIDKR